MEDNFMKELIEDIERQTGLNESELASNFGKRKQWLKQLKNAKNIHVETLIQLMIAFEITEISNKNNKIIIKL